MRKLSPLLLLVCCLLMGCSGLPQPQEESTLLHVSKETVIFSATVYPLITILVEANKPCTVSSSNDWCKATLSSPQSPAIAGFIYNLTINANGSNTTYQERQAVLTVQCGELSQEIQVTQEQNNAIIIDKTLYEVAPEGETIEIEVQANVSLDVSTTAPWITRVEGKSLTTTTYRFKIDKNDTPINRSNSICFSYTPPDPRVGSSGITVEVTQSGVEFTTTAQSPYELEGQGGSVDFTIQTSLPAVTIETSTDWITQEWSDGNPKKFTVKVNASAVARTGTITIKAGSKTETITVNQKGLFKKLVKQIISTNSSGTQATDFTYDDQSRLTKMGTTTYKYQTGEILELGQEKHRYLLGDGRITSVVRNYLSSSANTLYYKYTENKLVSMGVNFSYSSYESGDRTYTWSGENMVKMSEYRGTTYNFTYTISPNHINYDFCGLMNPTLGFIGRPSGNLIESYTVGTKTYKFTYQLDGDGCPDTVTEVLSENGASDQTTTYTIAY